VFADIDTLMGNVARVTAHLAAGGRGPRHAVRLRPAADGRLYVLDSAGAPWRTLDFIEGARAVARFDDRAQATEAAATAAMLVADLAGLTPALPEVIPRFHDVVRRLDDLAEAAAADTALRATACRAEVDSVLSRAGVAHEVAGARVDGRLPDRTVHNDAKAENLLFDDATGAGLCLVDLDTVGPGTVLFDVGDLVRSGAARLPEDGSVAGAGPTATASAAHDVVDHEVAAAILTGYARAGAGFLTAAEVELLPLAGPLMALEAAARFLTDHLRGDVYFKIEDPAHNLRRARNQLALFDSLAPA
jgi:aminoglycoside phosphotransferase (APT) family kinase protein